MTRLLDLREWVRRFYGKYEMYVKPGLRFVIAIITISVINGTIGYMERLNHPAVALVIAMICTFLPVNVTVVLVSVLVVAHLSTLSLEVCAVALLLFLVMFFLYFKYVPKDGYVAVLTPVLCRMGIGEIVPTAIGLAKQPYSLLSMVCGLVIYYFLRGVKANESLLASGEEDGVDSKITLALQQIVENKELYVALLAFVATLLIVYTIRRQSMDHSWSVAVAVGNVANLLILLVGSFLIGKTENIPGILVGTVLAAVAGLLMEFFLFHLDYVRTERVQFEDDEYYYYVKAIPKIYVSNKEKKVKQISGRKTPGISRSQLADEFDIEKELLDD